MKTIQPGQLIYWKGSAAIVLEFKGFQELIVRSVESGKTDIVHLREISLRLPSDINKPRSAHLVAEDKEWNKALERFEIIKPLLSIHQRSAEQVQQVAKKHSKGVATIYRWIKQFEETGLVSSLLRQKRTDSGETKLDKEVEELIGTLIKRNTFKKKGNLSQKCSI